MRVRWLRFVINGVMILCIASPAWAEEKNGLTPVTLQLKWQHAFQFAGYYAALAQGYYQSVGLEVRFTEGKPGVDTLQEVLSGRADFGIGTTELLLSRQQGAPVSILGVVYQHSPLQLLVLEESGIKDPKALHDKRVMMEQKASPEIRALLNLELSQSPDLFSFLKRAGVVSERYQSVEHTHTLDALLNREVDAMTIYTTNQPFELSELGVRYRILNPQMGGIDFYGDNLFTTDYLIRSRPNLVQKFYAASMRGWRYALEHPEEIIQLIYRDYSQRMSVAHLRYEAEVTAQLMQNNLIQPGYMNLDRWQHIVSVYQQLGDLPEGFDVTQMLYQEDDATIKSLHQQLFLSLTAFILVSLLGLVLWHFYRRAQSGWYRLNILLKHVPTAVIVIDAQHRIQLWNEGAQRIFGWTEEEAIGENILALLVPQAQREQIDRLFDQVVGLQGVEYSKNVNLHKDGRGLVCEWVNTPYRDDRNQQDYILCMAYDATKTETWTELVRAKEEAEQESHTRMAFLLHITRNFEQVFIQLDQLASQTMNTESQQQIQQVSVKGLVVARQVLDLSLLDASKLSLNMENLPLAQFLAVLVEQMQARCLQQQLQFVPFFAPNLPKEIRADAARLHQVLGYLFDNALRFTSAGRISFSVYQQDQGVCFEVADTGEGMDASTQAELFQCFSRLNYFNIQPTPEAIGLSLVLAKSLMTLMGGSLAFDSRLGEGSRFWVRLNV